MSNKQLKISVVGGGGHVGLPLSLLLVEKGFSVAVVDTDASRVEALKRGEFPFLEDGGPELLAAHKNSKRLSFGTDISAIRDTDAVIFTIGTPVDEHLNPQLAKIMGAIEAIRPHLRNGQVMIWRSTLFPGTSEKVAEAMRAAGLDVGVCFCPERIAQGHALKELEEFPQIISGSDERALAVAREIFSAVSAEVIELPLPEAELAKLFTNAWRYVRFAVANQFYMIAEEKGLNFRRVRAAMMRHYPRAADFPPAGFAAGPCLFKDTMQLAAFYRQNFSLGHAAMHINETMPDFLVEQAKRKHVLSGKKVGILGMAFKPNNDDFRDSLAFKLRRLLQYEGASVFCTDPYIAHPEFVPVSEVLRSCELIFIGCPHDLYRGVDLAGKDVADCWNFLPVSP